MAAYVVAQMHVHDVAKYLVYASKVGATIASYGGKIVAASEAEVREGSPSFTRTVIGEFPTAEAAREWYESEEYQAILPLRLAATTGTLFFVEGFTMPPEDGGRQE
ncbi:MAG: DUF1330 domain-containing protein [Chloroflexi bacterium]|nr:DUF1330 domain-containing protein [Chloroflexota bacterium]